MGLDCLDCCSSFTASIVMILLQVHKLDVLTSCKPWLAVTCQHQKGGCRARMSNEEGPSREVQTMTWALPSSKSHVSVYILRLMVYCPKSSCALSVSEEPKTTLACSFEIRWKLIGEIAVLFFSITQTCPLLFFQPMSGESCCVQVWEKSVKKIMAVLSEKSKSPRIRWGRSSRNIGASVVCRKCQAPYLKASRCPLDLLMVEDRGLRHFLPRMNLIHNLLVIAVLTALIIARVPKNVGKSVVGWGSPCEETGAVSWIVVLMLCSCWFYP